MPPRRFWMPMALMSLLITARGIAADADGAREAQLRAGYLLNFSRFVDWPAAAAQDPLAICFVNASAVRDALLIGAKGRQIGQHPITVRTLTASDATSGCQMLYLEGAPPPAVGAMPPAMLTVGDLPDFIHKGGMVELFTENNRLRFNINLDVAKRAGLHISSDLLQLASKVEATRQ